MSFRTLIFLVVFCSLFFQAGGQEQFYFNERIDHFNNSDNSRNIIEIEDGYIVFGHTEDSIYNYFYQYSFIKLSLYGDVEWVKIYGDTINDYLEGQPGSIIKYGENKYFSCGYKSIWEGSELSYCGYLLCLNNDFDTLWSRTYCENNLPYDSIYIFNQVKKCSDGGLIFTGMLSTKTEYSKIWLLKTDSLGNKIWDKFFSDGTQKYQGYSVIQTTDGGYAIGGYKYKPSDSNSGDPLIIKTDSLGIEEWTINPGSNLNDNKAMLTISLDGYIIAATNYGTESFGDNRKAKNQILIIRNDGEVISNKLYGESLYDNFLTQIIFKNNGEIVAAGSYSSFTPDTPSIVGWVLCLDENENQKWYHEYVKLLGEHSHNYLYTIISTNDSGFITCGYVEPVQPDTGNIDIWVLKLDSLGYDTTTVGIFERRAENSSELIIYPNPVGNELVLTLDKEAESNLSVSFFNMLGIKVEEIEIPAGKPSISVNVSAWESGMYVAVMRQQGKIIGKRKFVVQ
ncbi:MAG TPA: T9SS type A sorting domain-containing protein [Bacteroidales bacterium]